MIGQVFLSYSRKDEEPMRLIAKYLRVQGIKVWVDNEKLIPGTRVWENEIEKAIIKATAVVVILSPDARDSIWVRREISFAELHNKRTVPVLARRKPDDSMPLSLATTQYVDIRVDEEKGLNLLKAALLGSKIEPPPQRPPSRFLAQLKAK